MNLAHWLITFIGVIVPRRLRADWRQEREREWRYRETQLAQWAQLNRRTRLELTWHSLGAFVDALWLQPRRWEDEMFQDLRMPRPCAVEVSRYPLHASIKNPARMPRPCAVEVHAIRYTPA